MRWNEIGSEVCSVARALSIVGDRWTLLILREAFLRTRRFQDFQTRIGASRNIVADRLSKLVEHAVLERVQYQEHPPRFEYRLTQKGRDLYPVVLALANWGDRWLDEGKGRPIEHVHRSCGQVMSAVQTCSECGEAIDPREVETRIGPALLEVAKASRAI